MCTFLIAKTCTSLIAKTCAFLIAKKYTLLFTDYNCDINITENQIEKIDINNNKEKIPIDSPKLPYHEILNYFFIKHKIKTVIRLFEEFPDRYSETLDAIRFDLPKNISSLAKKYGFVEELRIIKISNKKIKELKNDPSHHEEWNMISLEYEYIKNYNWKRKKAAMKYIHQALIYFPFTIEKFLHNIRAYKYDDLDELVQKLKIEIYNTDKL